MAEQENLRTITDAYDAFSRGDIPFILARLTDDVTWESPGPKEIPSAGTYSGKAGVTEFFHRLSGSDDVQLFEPQHFFADGNMVVVLGRYKAQVKSTGQVADLDWVHVFTFRGDKVASWKEYFDTAKVAQAYEPSSVTVRTR